MASPICSSVVVENGVYIMKYQLGLPLPSTYQVLDELCTRGYFPNSTLRMLKIVDQWVPAHNPAVGGAIPGTEISSVGNTIKFKYSY